MAGGDTLVREDVIGTQGYARRFGSLLREHRRARGLRRPDLAARTDDTLAPSTLRQIERGRHRLDVDLLHRLAALYGLDVAEVLPDHRSVLIDLERRELRVGDAAVALTETLDPAAHLARYVSLVNRLRERPMRTPATLRRGDTEALAEAFELEHEELTALLADLIGRDAAARRRLMALKSGGGTLAAVVVLGAVASAAPPRGAPETDVGRDGSQAPSASLLAEADDDVGTAEPEIDLAPAESFAPSGQRPAGAVVLPTDEEEAAASEEDTAAPAEPATAPADDDPTPVGPTPGGGGGASAPDEDVDTPSAEPVPEDETNIDAPGGPVEIEPEEPEDETGVDTGTDPQVIERDPVDTPIEDETNIDAPGGPVQIERDGD